MDEYIPKHASFLSLFRNNSTLQQAIEYFEMILLNIFFTLDLNYIDRVPINQRCVFLAELLTRGNPFSYDRLI